MRVLRETTSENCMSVTDNKFKGIPVVQSGSKYQTEAGFAAIKNGMKQRADAEPMVHGQKPPWLRAKMPSGAGFSNTRRIVKFSEDHDVDLSDSVHACGAAELRLPLHRLRRLARLRPDRSLVHLSLPRR